MESTELISKRPVGIQIARWFGAGFVFACLLVLFVLSTLNLGKSEDFENDVDPETNFSPNEIQDGKAKPYYPNYYPKSGYYPDWINQWDGIGGNEDPFPKCNISTEKNEIYATLLLTEDYLETLLKLHCSMKKVGATRPLVVFYAPGYNITSDTLDVLDTYGIKYEPIELLYVQNKWAPRFSINWTRLRYWQMEQYSRIIYLDSDMFMFENIDHLFDLPHKFAVAADADRLGSCGGPMGFNQGGLLVIEPCEAIFDDMMSYVLSDSKYRFEYADAEQGFLNFYFYYNRILLPPEYNFLPHRHWNSGLKDFIKVIHYTSNKPFQVEEKDIADWHQPWFDCEI